VSQPVPPDALAFHELELLVRALGEELSRFRRRALAAEAQLKQRDTAQPTSAGGADPERLALLEAENVALKERLTVAAARTDAMRERLRFLRQQTEAGDPV
jgi:uncharacterized protein involved in exopolysaccharide biosynthesis